jgi:hypothetical protein
MKALLSFAIGVLASAPAAFGGSITMTLTPSSAPAAVAVDLTITDTGGAAGCTYIMIRRRAIFPCGLVDVVQFIPRQLGTWTVQFTDTVNPNTSYEYRAFGFGSCTESEFQEEFDPYGYGFPIKAYTTVGPDPTPIAHGRLVTSIDASAQFGLEPCSDSCAGAYGGSAGPEVLQYIDTGTELYLYGTLPFCCSSSGWLFQVTSAAPHPCPPIAVETRTWSNLKQLYR